MKEIANIHLPLLFPPRNILDIYHNIHCVEQAEQRAEDPFLKQARTCRKQLLLIALADRQKQRI